MIKSIGYVGGALFFAAGAVALPLDSCGARHPITLRIGLGSSPDILDPLLAHTMSSYHVLSNDQGTLFRVRPSGDIVPGIADKAVSSSDGLTWTLHIRNTARWSNGAPLRSEDFVRTFQRLKTLPPWHAQHRGEDRVTVGGATRVLAAMEVQARGPNTLIFTLKTPEPYFRALLAEPQAAPFYEGTPIKHGHIDTSHPQHLLYSGAYTMVQSSPHYIVLCKNPYYWNARSVQIQRLLFFLNKDTLKRFHQAYLLWRQGKKDTSPEKLDMVYGVPETLLKPFLYRYGRKTIRINPMNALRYYAFDNARPPFSGAQGSAGWKLRKALSMAVDRTHFVPSNSLTSVDYVPKGAPGPHAHPYTWLSETQVPRDEEARLLFKAAGFSASFPLRFVASFNPKVPLQKKILLSMVADWRRVFGKKDIHVHLIPQGQKQAHLYWEAWDGAYTYADASLEAFSFSNTQDVSHYKNSAYEQLLALEKSLPQRESRDIVARAAQRVLKESYPAIPLLQKADTLLVAPYIHGCGTNLTDNMEAEFLSIDRQKMHYQYPVVMI